MNKNREQLCPMWLSSLLGLGVVLVLATTYPRGDELAEKLASQPPSGLSTAYLEAWLRAKPNSPIYLHSLADQYLKIGKWDLALSLSDKLMRLAKDDNEHKQALLIKVAAAEHLAYQFSPDDPRRARDVDQFADVLAETLTYQWSVPAMKTFAGMAHQAGANATMVHYYQKLAVADTTHTAHWQKELGDQALAHQEYDKAAQAYFAAYDASETLADKRHYFIAALKVLEAGNQVNRACDEGAKRLGDLAHDRQTLRYLLDLARQVNRTELITRYARSLADLAPLSLAQPRYASNTWSGSQTIAGARPIPLYRMGWVAARPFSSETGARLFKVASSTAPAAAKDHKSMAQAEFDLIFKAFVESGQLTDAEDIARKALDAHLDPLIWTHRLAQVAQWNNHPKVSLKYWLLYAQATGNQDAWKSVFKLAPQLDDDQAYLAAWRHVQGKTSAQSTGAPASLHALLDEYMALDHWKSALRVIGQLKGLDGPKARQDTLLLEVTATQNVAYQYPSSDPQRAPAMVRYTDTLRETLHYQWDVPVMSQFAEQAQQAGATDVAEHYYQKLAVADTDNVAKWQGQLGDAALGQEAYDNAAQAYFAAQGASTTLEDKRHYFLAALKALVSGDQVDRACAEGEKYVGDLDKDPQTLRYLLDVARQASRKDLMARYARDLVKYSIEGKQPVTGSIDYSAYPDYASYAAARHAGLVRAVGVSVPRYLDGLAGARYLEALGGVHIRRIAAVEPSQQTESSKGKDSDYDLAFRAFVASNQLDDAEQLARRALENHLDPLVWTRRLAQVAQWNNHPHMALKYWLLFAKKSGNEEAWGNVLKLAPQLDDNAAYLAALIHESDRSPGNLGLYDKVVTIYERLGRPEAGMAYLKARAAGSLRRPLLERYAALAQRSGNDKAALRTYRRLLSSYPSSSVYATDVATLEFQDGNRTEALSVLRGVKGDVGNGAATAPYWRLYASLSRQTDNDQEANFAYKNLLATGYSDAVDLNAMTDFYAGHPIDAGRTAEMEFRKGGEASALRLALQNYTAARAWLRIQTLLHDLTPDQKALFADAAPLLAARANYYLKIQRWDAALADFRQAVKLPNADDETRVSYLWALVDFGSDDELKAALDQWRVAAKTDSAYWNAFAAGEIRLGHAARALTYLRQLGVQSGSDPLWLMSLADAEDAAGHPDQAWGLRRKAWYILQREAASGRLNIVSASGVDVSSQSKLGELSASDSLDLRVARVALSQTYADGDYSRDLLVYLLKQETGNPEQVAVANSILANTPGLPPLPGSVVGPDSVQPPPGQRLAENPTVSAVAKSTMLAWAVSGEHNDLARAWLARQYVRRMLRPADAVVALALASNDRDTLARVLDSRPGQIPIGRRIDALIQTGRTTEAETLAFDASGGSPDNDELHEAMAEALLRDRPSVGVDVMGSSQTPLRYLQTSVEGGLRLTSRIGLQVDAIQRNQRTTDTDQLAWVPAHDREFNLSVFDTTIDRDLSLTVGYRDALESFYTGKLQGKFNRNGPVTAQLTLGVNQFTDVSPEMQVGATKDMAQLGLEWNPQGRWFLQGMAEADRFHAQDRTYMGHGYNFTGAVGYRIRSDYPDWNVRVVGARGIFSASDEIISSMGVLLPPDVAPTAREFMPRNFTQYGLMVGLGTNDPNDYSRAWRPFMDVGYVHDSNDGWGPQINLGVGGSLFGNDSLRIFYVHENTSSSSSQPATQVGLSYRLFY